MVHHHVIIVITMIVIAVIVRLKAVVCIINVLLISIISIVSIILIRHHGTLVLVIKLLHHHLVAAGVATAIVGITAWRGGRGVVTSIVHLRFTCLNFTALTEDVHYASFPWNIVEEGVCHVLAGKSNKSKATAPLGIPINHDHGINDFAKLFEETEELFIIDIGRQPPNEQLAWIRLSWWRSLPLSPLSMERMRRQRGRRGENS